MVSRHGRWRAAVLAAGPGAVLSHASAAAAWDLRPDNRPRIDVSVGPGGRAKRAGLVLHRRRLTAAETTTLDGLPVTTAGAHDRRPRRARASPAARSRR